MQRHNVYHSCTDSVSQGEDSDPTTFSSYVGFIYIFKGEKGKKNYMYDIMFVLQDSDAGWCRRSCLQGHRVSSRNGDSGQRLGATQGRGILGEPRGVQT